MVVAAQLRWWWKRRLCKDFPASLPRFISIMLRSAKNLVLEMVFLKVKKMIRIKLHTFLARTGGFCSIIN